MPPGYKDSLQAELSRIPLPSAPAEIMKDFLYPMKSSPTSFSTARTTGQECQGARNDSDNFTGDGAEGAPGKAHQGKGVGRRQSA